jgi:hypothetical protein
MPGNTGNIFAMKIHSLGMGWFRGRVSDFGARDPSSIILEAK